MLAGTGLHLVVVSHSTGFREIGKQTFSPEAKKKIEALGGTVYTGTMVLHGLGNALRDKGSYAPGQVVADSLRYWARAPRWPSRSRPCVRTRD